MNSGMYSALSGNITAMRRLDVIASNLANVGTTGFKQDRLAFESVLAGNLNPPAIPDAQTADPALLRETLITDFSSGSQVQTGNTYDVAIQGEGFFAVRTPDGVAYTRNGNFRLSNDGTLVTSSGFPVLSIGGGRPEDAQPIRINVAAQPGGIKPVIDSQGNITLNGEQSGGLAIFDFPKPYRLTKQAGSLFVPENGTAPQVANGSTAVSQGYLEQSNVNSISEMVQMIETSRYFETCQKMVRSFDDMTGKAVNDLARV